MNLEIFTDGGARGNPGPAAIAMVAYLDKKIIAEAARPIGVATNNVAEYRALLEALRWVEREQKNLLKLDLIETVKFFLDANLVVNQLNGIFKIKHAPLRTMVVSIRILEQEIKWKISYSVIPREQNIRADKLVNQALDTAQPFKHVTFGRLAYREKGI
ncbi:ribonuclease HI family protein [Candidatus Gottesmanbacteria bacterium]|nr:ribonuclease HI family protein [Candidatus Gottesmanbacteria bacterium]